MIQTDERAVSTVVGYVLTLGISSLLIVGLLVATTGYVDSQRQATVRDEMEVLGQHLAFDLEAADRLVQSGDETVEISRNFPETVTGVTYHVEVDTSPPGLLTTLRLTTDRPEVTVEVDVRTSTSVASSSGDSDIVDGGTVVVEYDGVDGELEVHDA